MSIEFKVAAQWRAKVKGCPQIPTKKNSVNK